MALVWGSWTTGYSNNARMGIDLTVSGTTITARYYVEFQFIADDTMTLVRTGSISGNHSFRYDQSGGVMLITTNTRSGNRGTNYAFGASLSGAYNGASPGVTAGIVVPAIPPATPARPTVTSITASTFRTTTVAPASNGAAITEYQWQWATNSSFTTGTGLTTSPGTVKDYVGFLSNQRYYVRVRALNSAGYSGWSTSNTFVTNPDLPLSPSNANVSRNSDTSHTVTWVRNVTSERPYTSITVHRRSATSASWSLIATLAGTATTYTDTSTTANNSYQYTLRGHNAAGQSPAGDTTPDTPWISTTPAAPSGAAAVKSGGNIAVSWVNNSSYGTQVEVWHAANGVWDGAALATVAAGTTTYTHISPNAAVTHTYRMRAKSAVPVLYSGYSTSNVVQLQAPPSAPTPLLPQGVVDAGLGPILLTWRHNPVDSSTQRQFQLRHRLQGAGTWTTTAVTVSAVSSYELTGYANEATVEWQVMTWGDHATGSAWSATSAFQTSATPTASIASPATTWDIPQLTVEWTYYQDGSSPQGSWEVELHDELDNLTESLNGTGTASSAEFNTLLPDDTTWTVRVRLRSGAGLWSEWASQTFTVAYAKPPTPIVSAEWFPESGAVVVGIENPAGEPTAISNDIYRSIDGGAFRLIATGVPVNGVVSDFEAASIGTNTYQAVAWSELPSASESEPYDLVIAPDAYSSGYLSAGPQFSVVGRALYNLRVQSSGGRIRVQRRFAGRSYPVQYEGESLSQQLSIEFVVLPAEDEPDASLAATWEQLANLSGPHLWRDPDGRRIYGTLGEVSISPMGQGASSVSFTLDRTGER